MPADEAGAEGVGDAVPEAETGTPTARQLTDISALAAKTEAPGGAAWKLAEPDRQLDANLVHLPAGKSVESHREPDLDVLLLVVSGDGTLSTPEGPQQLTKGAVFWLPHGSTRSLSAGEQGLYYLTVHRRRPGMSIGRR